MGLMGKFLRFLVVPEVEENEEEPEDDETLEEWYDRSYDWRTFRVDENVWVSDRKPDIHYVRALQTCYEQALVECYDSMIYDTAQLRQKVREANEEVFDLHKQLSAAMGTIEILQKQLGEALDWQSVSGRKAQVMTENGYAPDIEKEQPKDVENKFKSASGRSGKENMIEVACMKEAGWSNDQIAQALGIKASSIPTYFSNVRKGYTRVDTGESVLLQFKPEYGGHTVDLEIYRDAIATTSNMGVVEKIRG